MQIIIYIPLLSFSKTSIAHCVELYKDYFLLYASISLQSHISCVVQGNFKMHKNSSSLKPYSESLSRLSIAANRIHPNSFTSSLFVATISSIYYSYWIMLRYFFAIMISSIYQMICARFAILLTVFILLMKILKLLLQN